MLLPFFLKFSTISLILTLITLSFCGCQNSENRREARWAAFDPLRPDPQFRLLPDRPRTLHNHTDKQSTAPQKTQLIEPPVIWVSHDLEKRGLQTTVSKIHNQTLEQYFIASTPYRGELLAIAKNKDFAEVSRVHVQVELQKAEAKYIEFKLPGNLAPDEIKLISIEEIQ